MEHHNEEFVWIVSWNGNRKLNEKQQTMSFFNFDDALNKIQELMIQGEKQVTISTSI